MLDKDIQVIRQAQDAAMDRDGSTTRFIRVDFYVGKHGPFTEKFPRDNFTAQVRDDKLNAFGREVRTEPLT
jgi:hypothetical protein